MTPRQLHWTDKQWAIHLNCPVQEIPSIRAYVHANFFPVIEQDKNTKAYNFLLTKMSTSMAGTRRVMPMISDKELFSDFESSFTTHLFISTGTMLFTPSSTDFCIINSILSALGNP